MADSRAPSSSHWWSAALVAGCLAAGCGLGDSAQVECRCTPQSNRNLFPACPAIVEVLGAEESELWVTAAGDTLDAAADWVTVKGNEVRYGKPGSPNPFTAEVADCPVGPRLVLNEPTRPSLVVFNLRTIFLAPPSARNLDQYMDQLSQDFTFVPDTEDAQAYPHVYNTALDTVWSREQERRFAQALLDPTQVGKITLTRWYESSRDERIVAEDQLHETYIFPYEGALVRLGELDGDDVVLDFKGVMELDLVTPTLENPVWSIRQWRDLRDLASAKRSWGELRAEFTR
jgi:hypothetical protein